MIERQFEERVRAWYRADVEEVGGQLPASLRSSVLAIPDEMPHRAGAFATRRRLVVLLAAAMLTALLVGAALAVGSGMLRLPWLPDERSQPLGGLSGDVLNNRPCEQTMPDGLLLYVEKEGGPSGMRLLLNDQGLLLQGPLYDETSPWEQRRLSPGGVQRLLAAVLDSGLRDCQSVPVQGPVLRVIAETDGGVVSVSFGHGWMRMPTQAELDAGALLAERLGDPDLGIPASDWVDPEWLPYLHDRWQVMVHRWEGRSDWSDPGTETEWDEVVLPDGSTFRTFGDASPRAPYGDFVELRCRVVDAAEAAAFRTYLSGLPGYGDPSILQDPSGGVVVEITPVLPHEEGCGPDTAPSARINLIEDLRVCQYIPERTMRQVNGLYRPVEMEDFGGGWAACDYYSGGWLFASRHPITSEDALGVVENQFGVGNFTTDEIDGRTVYLSSCDPDSSCYPAIAISAEPHFVILVGAGGESTLRLLAAAVIKEIERIY